MFTSPSSSSPKMADLIFSTFSSEHTVTLPQEKFFDTFFRLHGFQPPQELLESKLFLSFDRNEHLIKLKVEREDICVFSKKCEDSTCELLHNIRKMDYCRSFTSFDGCPRKNECQFLHVPSMRLCDRVVSVFGWRGAQSMSEADFIEQHARVYPHDHQPVVALLPRRLPFIRLEQRSEGNKVHLEIDLDRDICKSWLSNCCSLKRSCRYLHPKYYCREFAAHKTCRKYPHCPFWHIAGKFISPPPSRAETLPRLVMSDSNSGLLDPHFGHKSVVLTNLDERWEDDTLISDIRSMFEKHGFKVVDIFMRGRIRLAFVQLGSEDECKRCIDRLDDSWCFNRIVRVERAHRGENRICVKTLNSEVVDVEVKHWLEPLDLKVQRVCIEEKFSFGSNIAFIFLQNQDECERAIALHQREKLRGRLIGVEHPRSIPLIHQLPLRHTHEPDNWTTVQHKGEPENYDEFDQRSGNKKKRALRNPANVQTSHPSFRNSRLRKEIRRRTDGAKKSLGTISNSSEDMAPPMTWGGCEEKPSIFLVQEDTKDINFMDAQSMQPNFYFVNPYDDNFAHMQGAHSQFYMNLPRVNESMLSPRHRQQDEIKETGWFDGDCVSMAGSVPELPPECGSEFWNGYMYALSQQMGSSERPNLSWSTPAFHRFHSVPPSNPTGPSVPSGPLSLPTMPQGQQHTTAAQTGYIPTTTGRGPFSHMMHIPTESVERPVTGYSSSTSKPSMFNYDEDMTPMLQQNFTVSAVPREHTQQQMWKYRIPTTVKQHQQQSQQNSDDVAMVQPTYPSFGFGPMAQPTTTINTPTQERPQSFTNSFVNHGMNSVAAGASLAVSSPSDVEMEDLIQDVREYAPPNAFTEANHYAFNM